MSRLDEKRVIELTPKRFDYALKLLKEKGLCIVSIDTTKIIFERVKGKNVILYPYSGWWSGKGVGSGRGVHELIKLL